MRASLVLQAPDLQREELRLCDFRNHPDELLLDKLVRSDRFVVELLSLLGVAERGLVASHGRPDSAPTDAIPGLIEAGERSFQSFDAWEEVVGWDPAVRHRE